MTPVSFWWAVEEASLPPSLHRLKGSRDLGLGLGLSFLRGLQVQEQASSRGREAGQSLEQ